MNLTIKYIYLKTLQFTLSDLLLRILIADDITFKKSVKDTTNYDNFTDS